MSRYGLEVIIDVHDCEVKFTREVLEGYVEQLCILIDMEREDLHFWDYEGDPEGHAAAPAHLRGISLVQFIKTSSIVVHTLDAFGLVMVNIFSCIDFETVGVKKFTELYFKGTSSVFMIVDRGVRL